jgi:flavodoxin I
MKALVVYDSIYGNTEKIAQAIGGALGPQAEVQVMRVGDAKPEHVVGLSLLVAGAPTHGSMPSPAMKAWLKALASNRLQGVKVAAFDTRVAVSDIKPAVAAFFVKLFGYAAPQIADSLTKHGGTLGIPAEGFFVNNTQGPLKEGEIERAAAWARQIMAKM